MTKCHMTKNPKNPRELRRCSLCLTTWNDNYMIFLLTLIPFNAKLLIRTLRVVGLNSENSNWSSITSFKLLTWTCIRRIVMLILFTASSTNVHYNFCLFYNKNSSCVVAFFSFQHPLGVYYNEFLQIDLVD